MRSCYARILAGIFYPICRCFPSKLPTWKARPYPLLRDIQAVIQDMERSDFEMVEDIVTLFEEYGLDAGVRHDF